MICRLVSARKDKAEVRLCLASRFPGTKLGWPTVACWADDGELVGALSTVPKRNALVAGPILALYQTVDGVPVFAALVKCYEAILVQAGITRYLFSVARENEKFITILSNSKEVQPYGMDHKSVFFQRTLEKGAA